MQRMDSIHLATQADHCERHAAKVARGPRAAEDGRLQPSRPIVQTVTTGRNAVARLKGRRFIQANDRTTLHVRRAHKPGGQISAREQRKARAHQQTPHEDMFDVESSWSCTGCGDASKLRPAASAAVSGVPEALAACERSEGARGAKLRQAASSSTSSTTMPSERRRRNADLCSSCESASARCTVRDCSAMTVRRHGLSSIGARNAGKWVTRVR